MTVTTTTRNPERKRELKQQRQWFTKAQTQKENSFLFRI